MQPATRTYIDTTGKPLGFTSLDAQFDAAERRCAAETVPARAGLLL